MAFLLTLTVGQEGGASCSGITPQWTVDGHSWQLLTRGTGIDFMYDHLVVQDLMPLARGTHANILLPSEPLKIGPRGAQFA